MPAPKNPTPADDANKLADADKLSGLVDGVKKDVEPKTDALGAIEALVKGQAGAFKTAIELGEVEAHEAASQFESRAHELAEAALAGVEAEWAKLQAERGVGGGTAGSQTGGVAAVEREQPAGLRSPMAPAATLQDAVPHNQHVVEAASEAGMDPELARQMSTHNSNV